MKTIELKDACEKITDETHHSPPVVESGIPYITAKHIKKDGIKFFEKPWFVSEEDHREIYARCDPQQGDVLYIKDGATTGIAAINEYDFPFSMLSSVALLRPDPSLCIPGYLTHWLNSPNVKEANLRRMGGAAIKRLTLAKIKGFKIPLPPLAEQKRLAAILDAADALRAKRQKALAHLDDLLQSTFLTLFGDPVTNPMGWEKQKFGEVTTTRLGKMLDKGKQSGSHQYPYLANLNVQWGRFVMNDLRQMDFDKSDRKEFELKNGDLLICEGGEIGRCAIWRNAGSKIYFQKALHRCRANEKLLKPEYVQYFLWFMAKNGGFKDFVTSATIAHLTGAKLKKLPIPLPPLPLQKRFAAIVEKIEAQKARHRAHLAELDTIFASLQSRAFSGEL